MAKIEIETPAYNRKRYGQPWCALVSFARSAQGEYTWGTWVGEPGQEGLLVIEAPEGAIVAHGQKDHRGSNSTCIYAQVREGRLVDLPGKLAAYRAATGSN